MSGLARWPGAAALVAAVAVGYAVWYAAGAGFAIEPDVECAPPVTADASIQAVFGRFDSYDAAEKVQRLAAARGFQGTKIEVDPCGRVALVVEGIPNLAVGRDYVRQAESGGFPRVTLEQNP